MIPVSKNIQLPGIGLKKLECEGYSAVYRAAVYYLICNTYEIGQAS